MSHLKLGLMAAAIVVFGSFIVVAYSGARNRGLQTHCKNNLRFLGERAVEVIREAYLNPYRPEYVQITNGEARGRQFWMAVHEVKLRNKGRDLSPYECPFARQVGGLARDESLRVDRIDYRGPNGNATKYDIFTPLACDRADNHPDGTINVLMLKVSVEKRGGRRGEDGIENVSPSFQILQARRGDELWNRCEQTTRD